MQRSTAVAAIAATIVATWTASLANAQTKVLPAPQDKGAGMLFHASFDKDRKADFAVGPDLPCQAQYARANRTAEGGTLVPGVFGKALTGSAKGGFGNYDALGNFLAERGTIAFFLRQEKMPYGFEPFWLRTVDAYYWSMYTRVCYKGAGALSVWFPNEIYRPATLSAGKLGKLEDGKWLHVAVAWDQAYGVRFYLDGKEVASSWGKETWTSRGVDPDFFQLAHNAGVAYDEVYVFDRALTAAQIARLHAANQPPSAKELEAIPLDEARRRNRLREMSWQKPDPSAFEVKLGATGLGANAIRQVLPVQARTVMKDGGEATDGKLGQGWPPLYNYGYGNGNGLHVEMDQPWDLAFIEGYFRGKVYGERRLLPGGEPIAAIQSPEFKRRWALPRGPGWLSFFKDAMEELGANPDKELVTQGRICELSFFQRGKHALDGAQTRALFLGPASAERGAKTLGVELTGRYGPGDRASMELLDSAPAQPGGQAVPGLRFHHVVIPPLGKETGLRGVRLAWTLNGKLNGNALAVELRDPALPGRRLFGMDCVLQGADAGPQTLDLTLDVADRLLPADKPLWMVFCFKDDVEILWQDPKSASRVELLLGTPQEVAADYLRADLAFMKSRFREMSESRPWCFHKEPEKEMVEFSRSAREVFLPLTQIWKALPNDPKVKALWYWTHKSLKDESPVEPLAVASAPGAPRWALLQRELLAQCRNILYWWIENRQAPNGEFGDAWGDDTDLMQNTAKITLLGDPGGRIAAAAKLVADGVYADKLIERGINRRTMDTLHAYEEGVNVQPVLALIDYGNPHYLERMMEAARTVETHLCARDKAGRLRFRSWDFGANEVRDKGNHGYDHPGNALFCHPALFLTYYSRNPKALKFLKDWVDGWLDFYAKDMRKGPEPFPSKTLMDGTVIGWDSKVRGYGYPDTYLALFQTTGDRKYAEITKYWTGAGGPGGGFMRGANYIAGMEMIDRKAFREHLIKWAETADLSCPSADDLGSDARERYMKWEVTGDEKAVYEALEACVRKVRLLFDAYTWGEPIDDRIWLPDHPLIMMTQGEISHERNQIWPRHYVSYLGLSDFAAWVRERSDTSLRVWIYSFADKAESGHVRVWRTPLGRYRVRLGPDANADGQPDSGDERVLELHRSAAIPVQVPPRTLCALEVSLVEQAKEDFWTRPDLAVSLDSTGRDKAGALVVKVHNVGGGAAKDVAVRAATATGREIGRQTIPRLEAPLDLNPRSVTLTFGETPAEDIIVSVDPAGAIAELNELNNSVVVRGQKPKGEAK